MRDLFVTFEIVRVCKLVILKFNPLLFIKSYYEVQQVYSLFRCLGKRPNG